MLTIKWGEDSQEQRMLRRRLEEEAILEQAIRFNRAMAAQAAAVGSGRLIDPTTNQYVENGYIADYFE